MMVVEVEEEWQVGPSYNASDAYIIHPEGSDWADVAHNAQR